MIDPIDALLNKSIKELKANSKAMEQAIENLLEQDGIKVSESEFSEIRKLTNTMDELDSVLYTLNNAPEKPKAKPKKRKKRKVKRKK